MIRLRLPGERVRQARHVRLGVGVALRRRAHHGGGVVAMVGHNRPVPAVPGGNPGCSAAARVGQLAYRHLAVGAEGGHAVCRALFVYRHRSHLVRRGRPIVRSCPDFRGRVDRLFRRLRPTRYRGIALLRQIGSGGLNPKLEKALVPRQLHPLDGGLARQRPVVGPAARRVGPKGPFRSFCQHLALFPAVRQAAG